MASNAAETLIGAAVLVAAGGFLLYAASTADVSAGGSGYELVAKFRKAEGIDEKTLETSVNAPPLSIQHRPLCSRYPTSPERRRGPFDWFWR